MKELVIISGKGGTGKTSLVAAFSYLADNMVLCDADVDAADLHLLLNPVVRETHAFEAGAPGDHRSGEVHPLRAVRGDVPMGRSHGGLYHRSGPVRRLRRVRLFLPGKGH